MRMSSEVPDTAACCEAVLSGFVACARILIRNGVVPPFPHNVKDAKTGEYAIRYQVEPAGQEDWKLPHNVIRDGWGDCEDLALWVVAGLQETGEDPGARCRIVRTGRGKLHCVVAKSDGTFEDPSVDLMTPADMKRYTSAS